MALRISRRSTDCGRPPGLGLGIRGWTSFHWASVRSVGYFARLIPFSTPKTSGEVHFSHRLLGVGEIVYLLPRGKDFPGEVSHHLNARGIKFRFVDHVDHLLAQTDLVETIGVNHPDHTLPRDAPRLDTVDADSAWYRVTREKLERLAQRSRPVVLHPGPRTDEIATDVDDHPSARYFEQARNGMWIEWHSEIYKLLLKLGIDRCRPPWVKVKDW